MDKQSYILHIEAIKLCIELMNVITFTKKENPEYPRIRRVYLKASARERRMFERIAEVPLTPHS